MSEEEHFQISHQLTLSADSAGYIASYRHGERLEAAVTLWLPRQLVDRTVRNASRLALDLTVDGMVMVYAEGAGSETLAGATLETLIAAALEVVDPECDRGQLPKLEAQLEAGLAAVRQAVARLGPGE